MSRRRLLVSMSRILTAQGRRLPDLSWVTPSLSISGSLHPRHFEGLAQLEIGAIVDLREEGKDDEELLALHRIQFLHLPVPNYWAPSQAQLVRGTEWVGKQLAKGRKTLIHCREGVGRSVVLACCVLIRQGYDLLSARRLVKSRRWGVALNPRQVDGLEEFAWLSNTSKSAHLQFNPHPKGFVP